MRYLDISDLSIGSTVSYFYPVNGTMKIDTIKSIYFDDESNDYKVELTNGDYGYCHLSIKSLRGVLLTDDILVKCGFIKEEVSAWTGGDSYKYNIYKLPICDDDVYFLYDGWSERMKFVIGVKTFYFDKYLHCLQDQYRMACGEVLTIKK